MVRPTKCKICGHEHWGLAHIFDGKVEKPSLTARPRPGKLPAFVTKPVTSVTKERNKPEPVTEPRNGGVTLTSAASARLTEMEGEIKQLKRMLAEANQALEAERAKSAVLAEAGPAMANKPKPMTAAERMKKMRGKTKAAKDGVTEFEG